jgi:hypothetical protein
VSGLFLNSYPLTLSGDVELYEMTGAARTHTRDDLRSLAGVPVWMGKTDAFACDEPAATAGIRISKALTPADALALFAVREAIVRHCRSIGFDAWIGRAGELHVVGAIPSAVEDRFRIEHGLHLRVSREDYVDADAILTVRHRTHWWCADPLTDPDVARLAPGRRAIRVAGDGPLRGIVRRVVNEQAVLDTGGQEVAVAASDYTISVNSALVANWRGSQALRRLRIMSGDLTATGKRNRHGVEDRFKLAGDAVRKLGSTISVRGGGQIHIPRVAVAIRLEPVP